MAAEPITIADIKSLAKTNLARQAWDYYATGADEEQTRDRNETIFKEYDLWVLDVEFGD